MEQRELRLGMPLNGGTLSGSVCENTKKGKMRYDNKRPYNAYRGFGKDLTNMLIERTLDLPR